MIYPPNQKPPIWSIDPGIIAYNCQKAGMPHPVLAMPFWERGGARALDYSGKRNHGAITGADWVADGLDFVAANSDYVESPFTIGYPHTIITTFKTGASGTSRPVCIADTDSADYFFALDANIGVDFTYWFYAQPSGNMIYTAETPTANTEYSVVGRSSSSDNHDLYINGIWKANSTTDTLPSGLDTITFGALQRNAFVYSDCTVFSSLVYNTALSAAQIKLIHDDPYFMYQIPEELYGYVAAAPPATSIPVFMSYYRQLRAA